MPRLSIGKDHGVITTIYRAQQCTWLDYSMFLMCTVGAGALQSSSSFLGLPYNTRNTQSRNHRLPLYKKLGCSLLYIHSSELL